MLLVDNACSEYLFAGMVGALFSSDVDLSFEALDYIDFQATVP